MERGTWTDERLDDLARRMDDGFARVAADIRELRAELRSGIDTVRVEIGGLRTDLGGEISSVRDELAAFRLTLLRVGGGIIVGLVGVIGTVLIGG